MPTAEKPSCLGPDMWQRGVVEGPVVFAGFFRRFASQNPATRCRAPRRLHSSQSGVLSISSSSSSPMARCLLAFLLLLTSEVHAQGRLKLTVLSEDRLQMKWREADGPVQGYKVRVKPIADVPQPELMLTTTRGGPRWPGWTRPRSYNLQVLLLNGTAERLLAKRRFTISGLREEELLRSGGRDGKRRLSPIGSGSGDLDDVTDALLGAPTVLYQDTPSPTRPLPTSTTSTTTTSATVADPASSDYEDPPPDRTAQGEEEEEEG
ncbi:unnamed protein product [Gadus morhua 'NCC']